MDTNLLKTKFHRIGARAKVRPLVRNRWQETAGPVVIDIGNDRRGEFFDIQADDSADVEVLDVKTKDRHLLLMVRQPAERPGLSDTKDKFLCGHDERRWFVAGIPEAAPVSSVITAKEALKPDLVRNLESGKKGIFKYTSNSMYLFAFLTFWAIAVGGARCGGVQPCVHLGALLLHRATGHEADLRLRQVR